VFPTSLKQVFIKYKPERGERRERERESREREQREREERERREREERERGEREDREREAREGHLGAGHPLAAVRELEAEGRICQGVNKTHKHKHAANETAMK